MFISGSVFQNYQTKLGYRFVAFSNPSYNAVRSGSKTVANPLQTQCLHRTKERKRGKHKEKERKVRPATQPSHPVHGASTESTSHGPRPSTFHLTSTPPPSILTLPHFNTCSTRSHSRHAHCGYTAHYTSSSNSPADFCSYCCQSDLSSVCGDGDRGFQRRVCLKDVHISNGYRYRNRH